MKFKRICVIHLNQIGDLLFSLPVLKALRESDPEATIHSVIRPHLRDLLIQSPYVDRLIPKRRGLREVLRLIREIRKNRYDLLISLSNSQESLFLTAMSGAGVKAGFSSFPWDLGLDVKEEIEGHHSSVHNLKLLKRLNIAVSKKDYVGLLVLPAREEENRPMELPGFKPNGKYAVLSPGTSVRRTVKAWGEDKFADLILLLNERYGLNPVIVGGKDDQESSGGIIEALHRKEGQREIHVRNLAGKTVLKDLCYLLREADLFVGVDSGIMHLAASFDIPVVGIFGPTDPFYVGPQGARSVVVREELKCVPCHLKGCPERTCMEKLEVTKVLEACGRALHPLAGC
jgi:lipopolysaccharide heptosyltransferase II